MGTEVTTVETEETYEDEDTRENADNFEMNIAMIIAMTDQEMEATETISRKD